MTITFNKEDVFSWGNAEKAKQYIGELCYFGDSLYELKKNIEINYSRTLLWINNNSTVGVNSIFECVSENDPNNVHYSQGLMIPVDKVKVEESKKWRAFKSLDEFADALGVCHIVGTEIIFRNKGASELLRKSMITEMSTTSNNSFVTLGSLAFSLKSLFDAYEWLNEDTGEWQPFGVKE